MNFHLIKCSFPRNFCKLTFFIKLTFTIYTKQWFFKSICTIHDFSIKITLDTVKTSIYRSCRITLNSNYSSAFCCEHDTTPCATETTSCLIPSPTFFPLSRRCLHLCWNCDSNCACCRCCCRTF